MRLNVGHSAGLLAAPESAVPLPLINQLWQLSDANWSAVVLCNAPVAPRPDRQRDELRWGSEVSFLNQKDGIEDSSSLAKRSACRAAAIGIGGPPHARSGNGV